MMDVAAHSDFDPRTATLPVHHLTHPTAYHVGTSLTVLPMDDEASSDEDNSPADEQYSPFGYSGAEHGEHERSRSTSLGAPTMESRISSGNSMLDLKPIVPVGQRCSASVKVKQRRRTTPEQLKVLDAEFGVNPKPDVTRRKELAAELSMTPREVQVWYQNRRAKQKKLLSRASEGSDVASYADGERYRGPPEGTGAHLRAALIRSGDAVYTGPLAPYQHPMPTMSSYAGPSHPIYSLPGPTSPLPTLRASPSYPSASTSYYPVHNAPPPPNGNVFSPIDVATAAAPPPSVLTPSYGFTATARSAYHRPYDEQPAEDARAAGRGDDPDRTPTPGQATFPSYAAPAYTQPYPQYAMRIAMPPPHMPRMESNESMPSTTSSAFTDFAFGSAERRTSLTSELSTDGGSMTPYSATFPSTSPGLSAAACLEPSFYPEGFDPDARRASCPAEFVASFGQLNAPAPPYSQSRMHNEWVNPPPPVVQQPSPRGYGSFSPGAGRRHSVASPVYVSATPDAEALGVRATTSASTSGLVAAVLPPHLAQDAGSPSYTRRGSTASLLSLDPIAEYGVPADGGGGTGAMRRPSMSRKARSQVSMRHFARPALPPLAASGATIPFPSTYPHLPSPADPRGAAGMESFSSMTYPSATYGGDMPAYATSTYTGYDAITFEPQFP